MQEYPSCFLQYFFIRKFVNLKISLYYTEQSFFTVVVHFFPQHSLYNAVHHKIELFVRTEGTKKGNRRDHASHRFGVKMCVLKIYFCYSAHHFSLEEYLAFFHVKLHCCLCFYFSVYTIVFIVKVFDTDFSLKLKKRYEIIRFSKLVQTIVRDLFKKSNIRIINGMKLKL